MKLIKKTCRGVEVALIRSDEIVLEDVQSALDLLATVKYETDCDRIILCAENIVGDFFELKTRIAGEVLQKFVNYHAKLAIVGDFSAVESKSLRDFIRESNRGKDIFFVATEEEAIHRLTI